MTEDSMGPIPEEVVEETWQEVAGFAPRQQHKEMGKVAKYQPDLLAFMMEFTEELDQEVKELAIYMFFVVYRIFEKNSKKRIRKISAKEIIECHEYNEGLMKSLEGAHEKFFERIARTELSRQPYVIKYVTDTLIEVPEEEDPVVLTEEDVGFLFLLLKTVVDVVDKTV
jgi:hypothetical protein